MMMPSRLSLARLVPESLAPLRNSPCLQLVLALLQRLVQLSAADIYRFADNKQDADLLLESIQSLRETGVNSFCNTTQLSIAKTSGLALPDGLPTCLFTVLDADFNYLIHIPTQMFSTACNVS